MIGDILGGVWQIIIVAGGALLAVFATYRAGGRNQRNKDKVKDHERADEIRKRAESDLPDRVREYDDAGYRD